MENCLEAQQYGAPIRPTAMPVDGEFEFHTCVVVEVTLLLSLVHPIEIDYV